MEEAGVDVNSHRDTPSSIGQIELIEHCGSVQWQKLAGTVNIKKIGLGEHSGQYRINRTRRKRIEHCKLLLKTTCEIEFANE